MMTDETGSHVKGGCSKLAQKEYKKRHEWVGQMIDWELCKKLIWQSIYNKWYMHRPEAVLINETLKILWDFEIQTILPVSTRKPGQILINKKRTCQQVDFYLPAEGRKAGNMPGS